MGICGTGPFDSDDAGDMVAAMMKAVKLVAERKSDASARYHYNEARACAQFILVAHGTDILGGPGLSPVIRALARMRMDREYVASFRTPRKIADALNLELSAVLDRMHVCKGCRKSISKSEWHELSALVVTARSQPVPRSARPRLPPRTTKARVERRKKVRVERRKLVTARKARVRRRLVAGKRRLEK